MYTGKDKRLLLRNIVGIGVFVLLLPVLWQRDIAQFAIQEIWPGQVSAASFTPETEKTDATTSEQDVLIGIEDIEFAQSKQTIPAASISTQELSNMETFDYLKQNYYIIDARTMLFDTDVDPYEAIAKDFTIDMSQEGPKVLIFHTHISEAFADSDMSKGLEEGIWGTGEYLKELLEERYGIEVLHHDGVYDVVDGKGQITGAYERMEPDIREILAQYPSIQVCIDMHRDGVAEGTRLVTNIDGKECAQVMFFNGLCRLNQDGTAVPTPGLYNPYVADNLAFSLQMQLQANARYSGLMRKIYLNAYRFSLHFMPRSTLIEVGAQTNTKQEAKNAMEPLAEVLASALLGTESS